MTELGVRESIGGRTTPAELAPVEVSIVLPCLNEVESVGRCVDAGLGALAAAGLHGEVVVVDNGSTDGSALEAAAHGARVVTEAYPGYGSALRTGIAAARGQVVVMADADLTYPLERVGDLVGPVLQGEVDLVIGERRDDVAPGSIPFLHRYVGTPVLTFLVARACGGGTVRDSQSGFRAFRREAVLSLGLESTGMEFASEMLIRGSRAGLRVASLPTGYRPRVGDSKLNAFSDGWRHLRLILWHAPHLALVWPGALLAIVGVALAVQGLVAPAGILIGSLRWQPVFFSAIALVLGVQAMIAGMVLANRSSLVRSTVRRHYAFIDHDRFGPRCILGGLWVFVVGIAVDGLLFLNGVTGRAPLRRGLVLAALAQSLIICGASVATLGLVFGRFCRRPGVVDGDRVT